jgi:Tfp pilus assembly PilM family ATPase
LEKCWEKNIDVHPVFINFQAAYGSVWRKEMWSEMHKLGFSKTLVILCRILNNEIYAKCSQIMAYAGDVIVMGRKLQDAEEVFTSLVKQTNKMELEINEKKTKFMVVSQKPCNEYEY